MGAYSFDRLSSVSRWRLPRWGYHTYGYDPPSGILGAVLVVVLIMFLTGRL